MRFKFVIVFVCCFLFSAASAFGGEKAAQKTPPAVVPATGEKASQKMPSAVVPAESYAFEQVVEGTDILHDFIIQNKGAVDLEIKKVQPG